jgi:hypothetical protein
MICSRRFTSDATGTIRVVFDHIQNARSAVALEHFGGNYNRLPHRRVLQKLGVMRQSTVTRKEAILIAGNA